MKLKILKTRHILLTVFLIVSSHTILYSQGTSISTGKQQRIYLGFNICPVMTGIINDGSFTTGKLNSIKKGSVSGAIEAGYTFSDYFGVSTGIGFGSYSSNISLDSYNVSYDTTDSDTPKETYSRIITGDNISEIEKISFVIIPLVLNLNLPVNDKFGFYFQTGVNFSIPVSKSYSTSGTFTYEGFYSAYNLHITGIDYEGFKKNYNSTDAGELSIKSFNIELIASAGARMTLNDKVQISLGILYNKLMSDISDYSSTDKFRLSSVPDQMRSIMEGSTKTTASSMGLKISLRYYLK
jgi:hypothetical protein